ncbi:MAG: sel1 repeat family protein [Lachnospiraceae bacterium]|nr:sel1 repeat family protein [Lachnospiraceae bacterium]
MELGKVDANFYLGVLCDWYDYPKEDYEAARAYYEACPENPYAQLALGYLYWNGQGVEEDKEKAQEYFNSAAQNCVEGYLGLASVAYKEEDYAAAQGNSDAMYSIGIMYHNGEGVSFSYDLAKEWFQKAADAGNESGVEALKDMEVTVYGPNGVIQ